MSTDADEASFEEFVRARTGALARTAYLLTGDRHHAEDLVQTALARAAARWTKLDDAEAYVEAPPDRGGAGCGDVELRFCRRW